MSDAQLPPADWYDNPDNSAELRWWNGTEWTEHRKAKPAATPPPTMPPLPGTTPPPRTTMPPLPDAFDESPRKRGWHEDPKNPKYLRWWDGTKWAADTKPKHRPKPAQTKPAQPSFIRPEQTAKREINLKPVLIVAIVVVLIVLASLGGSDSPSGGAGSGSSDTGSTLNAWVMCQDFLEDRLKAPSTAEYPGGYSNFTTSLGGERYKVDAYVDSENSFGAMIRTDFSCTVRYTGNDMWSLENLVVDE